MLIYVQQFEWISIFPPKCMSQMALEAIQDHKLMQNEKDMLPGRGIEPTPSVAKNFPSVQKIFQVCRKWNFLNTWKIFLTLAEFSQIFLYKTPIFFTKTKFSLQKLCFYFKTRRTILLPYQKVAICAKKHSPSRLLLSQCLKNYPCVIFDFSLGILIEKTEPRIIPRSRPSASTSKRTSASVFSISIPKEKSQITLGKIF